MDEISLMSDRALLMIDLFSGLGGVSQPMLDRGWNVIRVDNDPRFQPTIVADVAEWSWRGRHPDLVWASPPCTEFAKASFPWVREKPLPSLALVQAALRVIEECNPRYWAIENVRGAIRWFRPILGEPRVSFWPVFLWGYFPDLATCAHPRAYKERISGRYPERRAKTPYAIGEALAVAIEQQLQMQLGAQQETK